MSETEKAGARRPQTPSGIVALGEYLVGISPSLKAIAMRILRSDAAAEDAVGAVAERILKGYASGALEDVEDLDNYIRTCVRNEAVRAYKARRREGTHLDPIISQLEARDRHEPSALEAVEFADLLQRLPVDEFEVVYLVYIVGMTQRSVAHLLDRDEAWVSRRKSKALALLREFLTEGDADGSG